MLDPVIFLDGPNRLLCHIVFFDTLYEFFNEQRKKTGE